MTGGSGGGGSVVAGPASLGRGKLGGKPSIMLNDRRFSSSQAGASKFGGLDGGSPLRMSVLRGGGELLGP